jgi:fumarylacetoacetase
VFGSGTVSGPERSNRGCLLELTWNGAQPLTLDDDTRRTWLEDGDEVVISARAGSVEFGEVIGRINART